MALTECSARSPDMNQLLAVSAGTVNQPIGISSRPTSAEKRIRGGPKQPQIA